MSSKLFYRFTYAILQPYFFGKKDLLLEAAAKPKKAKICTQTGISLHPHQKPAAGKENFEKQ